MRDGVWWEKGNTENEVGEGWSLVGKGNRESEVGNRRMESGRRKRTQKMMLGIERWSLVGEREHRE